MSTDRAVNAVDVIAAHAARRRYTDLGERTITRARQVLLDTLGTTLGGYQTRLGRLTADFAACRYPGEAATLVADGRGSTLEGAAWANGTMSKILGMDDTSRLSGHVASELVPVVLALGEHLQLSGRQLITALAVGYDVFDAIQPAVWDWQRERGLDHKSHVGSMAAAVTAAVAMGLGREEIGNALALAMDMASGTEQYVPDAGYCDSKDLLAGLGARNGIFAASLAASGFRGPPGALDGPYGYFHAFGPGFDPSFLENLGEHQGLAETGFKPHAGCRHVHSCVDATQALLKRNGRLDLDAIVVIEIDSYPLAITPENRVDPEPGTAELAGYSLPVTVAVVLQRGNWYRADIEACWDDPLTRRLRRLVKIGLDERLVAADSNGCEVRVTMHDGAQYSGRVEYALGEAENMLDEAQFEGKFRYLAGDLLPDARIDSLIDACGRLEELDDVGRLLRLTSAH
ncbi:MAG: MmgE/PrpD family protein [Anaerolineaceae bacterium]|nr:MmgE/PrpD family protein [Anaerolineaceae bacterium]MDE0328232.1 MmgE/PrpD family protein [Anaerolineaceae bacterium]